MLAGLNITIFICIILFSLALTQTFNNRYSNWSTFELQGRHNSNYLYPRSESVNGRAKDNSKIRTTEYTYRPALNGYIHLNSFNPGVNHKGGNKWQQLTNFDNWPYTILNKSKITSNNHQPVELHKVSSFPAQTKLKNYVYQESETVTENGFVSVETNTKKTICPNKSLNKNHKMLKSTYQQMLEQLQCFPESGKAKNEIVLPGPEEDQDYVKALSGELAEKITTEIYKKVLTKNSLSEELGITINDLEELQKIIHRKPWGNRNCCKFIASDLKCFLSWIVSCENTN